SITGPFLELFGRPSRDTGLESERNNHITDAQQMYLINSSELHRRIQSSATLRRISVAAGGNKTETIKNIYLLLLSRYPVDSEIEVAERHFQTEGITFKEAVEDLAWAIINSKEFLYRH
ncbi:MAG TPA: DUF1553 domain-containing protein, partial [bacterium]|nr:DUF1553 domain-containing protein [bacterium]